MVDCYSYLIGTIAFCNDCQNYGCEMTVTIRDDGYRHSMPPGGEYFDLWDSCMIKSLKLPKSGNQLRFLIHWVPSGCTSNALSIPLSGLIRSFQLKASAITFAFPRWFNSVNDFAIFEKSLIILGSSTGQVIRMERIFVRISPLGELGIQLLFLSLGNILITDSSVDEKPDLKSIFEEKPLKPCSWSNKSSILGNRISSGRKKSWGSNIGDSGNTRDGGKTVGGAIGACGRGIGNSLLVASYLAWLFILDHHESEMDIRAKRYLDKNLSDGSGEVFPD
ncbi:hypothetical protein Tco_1192132 [Tanacetum coccineum]